MRAEAPVSYSCEPASAGFPARASQSSTGQGLSPWSVPPERGEGEKRGGAAGADPGPEGRGYATP
jgi:hypothetical protein